MGKEQTLQLGKTILSFQKHINPLKQSLLSFPTASPTLLWNSMVTQSTARLTKQHMLTYLTKHSFLTTYPQARDLPQRIDLLLHAFSQSRDMTLTKGDFWEIFRPRTLPKALFQRDYPTPHCAEMHFRLTDLVLAILHHTLVFQALVQDMKHNLTPFHISPLTPTHLRLFFQLTHPQATLLLSHVVKNKPLTELTFFSYFIPVNQGPIAVNPMHCPTDQEQESNPSFARTLQHTKVVRYAKTNTAKHKPLYLTQRVCK